MGKMRTPNLEMDAHKWLMTHVAWLSHVDRGWFTKNAVDAVLISP